MSPERQLSLNGFEQQTSQQRPSIQRLVGAILRLMGGYNKPDFDMLATALPKSWETWRLPNPSTMVGKIRDRLSRIGGN